jgi:hypothetical protein
MPGLQAALGAPTSYKTLALPLEAKHTSKAGRVGITPRTAWRKPVSSGGDSERGSLWIQVLGQGGQEGTLAGVLTR